SGAPETPAGVTPTESREPRDTAPPARSNDTSNGHVKTWKQPEPLPFLERLFDFSTLQGSLSQEEKLLMGLALSGFFEWRREAYQPVNDGLADLRPAANAMFTFGDFKTALPICAVPFLFGDGEVTLAALEATFVAGVRTRIIKSVTGIERPLTAPPHVGVRFEDFYDNFPSGHSATVWAWATVLGEYYEIQWLTYPVATFMAVSLLARQNTHDFAEVLAGSMLGHQTGLESMRARGWLEPRTFQAGPLEVQTDIGVEQLSDSNPALTPGGSASATVGRFAARTRASYLVGDSVLLSARYDTLRRVYDALPGNNLDHNAIALRLDAAVSDHVLVGMTAYRDRVNFIELGPFSKVPNPALAVSTDPLFSNALLQDVRHTGLDLHALAVPADGWNVGAHLSYQGDRFIPDPGLSGDTFAWSLSGGTLLNEGDQGFQVHLGGGRSSSTPQFDRNFFQGGLTGRLALTHRDQLDLTAVLGTESYPGRGTWNEDFKAVTLQYSHRFGEDIWAWVGYTYEDRGAPAAGYSRSQPFIRLNGAF
ncbi:MAG: phosphatase PAP2 family protein, partial [Candidatus Eremiobacterota bacterium]